MWQFRFAQLFKFIPDEFVVKNTRLGAFLIIDYNAYIKGRLLLAHLFDVLVLLLLMLLTLCRLLSSLMVSRDLNEGYESYLKKALYGDSIPQIHDHDHQ